MGNWFGRRSVVEEVESAATRPSDEVAANPAERTLRPATGGRQGTSKIEPDAVEKYEVVAPIGRGGMGEVLLLRDRDLRREVAMKLIRAEYSQVAEMQRKFIAEAQATSQLDHPGIPPIHDLGRRPDGALYFTMRVVRGRTLTQVLRDLMIGVKETRREYTLHRLVSILERICEALDFAHERGVIHRDLKPDNVMLGSYGEVHVMDWGLAKVTGATGEDTGETAVRTDATDSRVQTSAGAIQGTIPYMSPEQARGEPVDRRTDVYALGTILYEILTLQRAFEDSDDLLIRVQRGRFPAVATRNPDRPVPEALAALCERAMSSDPGRRPASAREFAAGLRVWLDGRAEVERRHREAESLAAQGRDAMTRYAAARGSIEDAERAVAAEEAGVRPWQPVADKARLFAARRALEKARSAAALAFAETTRLIHAALVAEPGNSNARVAFADLWRGRLDEAERRRDAADADFALTMVRRYDDGRLASYLSGEGTFELETDRPGADVVLVRYEDQSGILAAGAETNLGKTPIASTRLAPGSYLALLRHPRFPEVRYPVHITRNRVWKARVTLRSADEVGDGFVYVPGGPFVYGEGNDARLEMLQDFAIAARPVTFAEWIEFMIAVEAAEGAEAAERLCPGTPGDGPFMERTPAGGWRIRSSIVHSDSEPALLARHGAGFEVRWPVMAISWHDAAAWCAWKTRTTGREWRLPTEPEREKAARGVDGRAFPWGELDDPTLAKCSQSRQEPSQPEPVGSFPTATSIYGMVDAAGGVWDWTDSWSDSRVLTRVVRGGSWMNGVTFLRCAMRHAREPGFRGSASGFRPARSLQ